MLKIYINNEEVVANQNFTINKHMLNTPSVILNNVCPKSWCENKDYSNFYHPQDYSKCKIQDETYIPAEPGIYTTITGSATIQNVDTSKLQEVIQLDGDTIQSGTPTPTSPQPINVVSGRQEVYDVGKNWFKYNTTELYTTSQNGTYLLQKGIDTTYINVSQQNNGYYVNSYTNTGYRWYSVKVNLLKNTSYKYLCGDTNITGNTSVKVLGFNSLSNGTTGTLISNLENGTTFNSGNYEYYMIALYPYQQGRYVKDIQIIKSDIEDTTYEAYTGQSYEINLGKNLFDKDNATTFNGYVSPAQSKIVNNLSLTDKTLYISIQPSTTYTISKVATVPFYVCTSTSVANNTSVSNARNVGNTATSYTITSGSNDIYLCITYFNNSSTKTEQEILDSIQIEKGGVQTVYTPYKTPIELCKIGDYKDRIFKNEDKILVPMDYTQVEYIESSGTQYINTEVLINSTSLTNGIVMELETAIKNKSNAQASGKNGHPYFFVGINGSNAFYSGLNTVYYATTLENDENKHTLKIDSINKTFSVDGAIKTNYTINTYDNTYSNNLYLFRVSQVGEYYMYQKLYRAKIYSQNTLVRDMIPCIRNSDNSVGMYDLVNGVFYANAGTGTFTYGAIIGKWNIENNIGKVVLNGTENWTNGGLITNVRRYSTPLSNAILNDLNNAKLCNYFRYVADYNLDDSHFYISNNGSLFLFSTYTDMTQFKNWLGANNPNVYFPLATPTYTEITDSELISQLEAISLINGLNNVSISSPYLTAPITIHYNFVNEETIIDLLFCGVVKNSGKISLNPREPHLTTLQILDFKDFLSSGETLDYVIYQKTILEAIQQVINSISDYGFVLGNINILNPNEVIGAYSTKDKTAYDVFNYIADITQSRWTARMVDENTVAIDFYDPTLMTQGTAIDYTQSYFENNLIDDMKYNYGTNNYRNKQIMVSNQVIGNLAQIQTLYSNGYQDQYIVDLPIAQIDSIYVDGEKKEVATEEDKYLGINADFYYSVNSNVIESEKIYTASSKIEINYVPVIEGRQVITNNDEISRINTSTGRKGIVSRYEQRNDATTLLELQKIGESYIKYKGTPEIVLTIDSRKNLWEVGQRVEFNAPIEDLDTEYMVRTKKINYIVSVDTLFYTYELVSSFNSETEINYFDNQRAKSKGNIGDGEYISRNIDIENVANVIFYDTTATEITLTGDNTLNSILNSPFID